eukprot:10949536-Ditylum_brightwellii.AAC.1
MSYRGSSPQPYGRAASRGTPTASRMIPPPFVNPPLLPLGHTLYRYDIFMKIGVSHIGTVLHY